MKGNLWPLIRYLTIFGAKYGLRAVAATHPEQGANLAPVDTAVSGFAAGYFIGLVIQLTRAYRSARATYQGAPLPRDSANF